MGWLARLKELPGVSYVVHKGKVVHVSEEQSERNQLIAQAQEAGVPSPWFKSNEDLRAAISAAGQTPASAEDALAADEADEAADASFTPPEEGADAADPYAHLGSNAPTGDEPEDDETEA